MTKSVKIWFPTYIGDFFTATASMTGHEVGAYQLLIAQLWKCGGSLKADDKQLAKLVKANARQWTPIRETLWPLFEIKGGLLTHPEVTQQIEKATQNQAKKRLAGIASGASRRGESSERPLNTCSAYVEPRADEGEGVGVGYSSYQTQEEGLSGGSTLRRDGLRVVDGGSK